MAAYLWLNLPDGQASQYVRFRCPWNFPGEQLTHKDAAPFSLSNLPKGQFFFATRGRGVGAFVARATPGVGAGVRLTMH